MTTIKATCPTCGEVSLTPDDIELRVDERAATESYYAFECPGCADVVAKPADARVVRLLTSGGVEVKPLEPDAPEERFPGQAPITHDDLLDFHHLLQDGDWFAKLLDSVRSS